jgi:hypothetical protein
MFNAFTEFLSAALVGLVVMLGGVVVAFIPYFILSLFSIPDTIIWVGTGIFMCLGCGWATLFVHKLITNAKI